MAGSQEYITDIEALAALMHRRPDELCSEGLDRVIQHYPFCISTYFANLIQFPGDPIWRQSAPDILELEDLEGIEDPLAEEALSPAPNLVHRYPDRVLWLVSHRCATFCRFCTRKRRWQAPIPMDAHVFDAGIDYIRKHSKIRDVLLSGGDPLMLPLHRLESIIAALRKIPHVEIIRIGTRVPCTFPRGITPRLVQMLSQYHPIYVNIHFNHPWEITPESREACTLLANAGIPLASQTVLLKGVNDSPETLRELFVKLLQIRVRPYYLLQMDLTRSTAHFRTPLANGLKIIRALRNHISGLAIPHFVIDLPGGRGKTPLLPNSIEEIRKDQLILSDFHGDHCEYPLLPGESEELAEWLL
jgi:lysine 2,3-aminomutase